MNDSFGRPYLTVEQAAPGMLIEVDDGFPCASGAGVHELKCGSPDGELYFKCENGSHEICGQEDGSGTYYIGLYPYIGEQK